MKNKNSLNYNSSNYLKIRSSKFTKTLLPIAV